MPSITLRMDAAEHLAWKARADAMRVPLAIWIRLTLNAESDKAAAPKVRNAEAPTVEPPAPKAWVKPGPKRQPLDAFLAELQVSDAEPFPSGQRRYARVWDSEGYIGQEGAHAAVELDLIAAYAAGDKPPLKAYPEYKAYRDANDPDAAYIARENARWTKWEAEQSAQGLGVNDIANDKKA